MTTQSEAVAVFEGLYATDGEIITNGNRLAAFVAENGTSLPALAALGVPYVVVYDMTAAELSTNNSQPILVMEGVSGKAIEIIAGASQSVRGTIPFTGGVVCNAYYEDDADDNALFSTDVVDPDPSTIDPFIKAGVNDLTFLERTVWEEKGIVIKGSTDDLSGAIATSAINAAVLGYAPGDTFGVDDVSDGLVGTVTTVGALGVVTGYSFPSPAGFGHLPTTGMTTSALTGIGTGFTLNILTITPANGTVRLWLTVQQLTLP